MTDNNFEFLESNGQIIITKYTGNSKSCKIPKNINNLPVTEIASNCFENNHSIEKIIIEEGITKINTNSFINCSNLKTILIQEDNIEIAKNAFNNCPNIKIIAPSTSKAINYALTENIKVELFLIFEKDVEKFEKYLLEEYKKSNIPLNFDLNTINPLEEKRPKYPHEEELAGKTYYENSYTPYIEKKLEKRGFKMAKQLDEIRIKNSDETIREYEAYLRKYYQDNKLKIEESCPRNRYPHEDKTISSDPLKITNENNEECEIPNVLANIAEYNKHYEQNKKYEERNQVCTKNTEAFLRYLSSKVSTAINNEEKSRLTRIHDRLSTATAKRNLMEFSLSVEDSYDIYNLSINQEDFDAIKDDLSNSDILNTSSKFTAIPKPYGNFEESIEDYENYLRNFYNQLQPKQNYTIVNTEQRCNLPHEEKEPYKSYYENQYLPFIKGRLNKNKNKYIIEKLNEKITALSTPRTQPQVEELNACKALLNIIEGTTITGGNDEVELLGAVVKKDDLDTVCKLIKAAHFDSNTPIYGIPQPAPMQEGENPNDYETRLKEHYQKYKYYNEPAQGQQRDPYLHEIFSWENGETPTINEKNPNEYYRTNIKKSKKQNRRREKVKSTKPAPQRLLDNIKNLTHSINRWPEAVNFWHKTSTAGKGAVLAVAAIAIANKYKNLLIPFISNPTGLLAFGIGATAIGLVVVPLTLRNIKKAKQQTTPENDSPEHESPQENNPQDEQENVIDPAQIVTEEQLKEFLKDQEDRLKEAFLDYQAASIQLEIENTEEHTSRKETARKKLMTYLIVCETINEYLENLEQEQETQHTL